MRRLSSVTYYSSHLVSDEDTLRLYLQKIRRICHENGRNLIIFHFNSYSVRFILKNQKGPKHVLLRDPSFHTCRFEFDENKNLLTSDQEILFISLEFQFKSYENFHRQISFIESFKRIEYKLFWLK